MKFLTAIGGIALAGLLILTGLFAFNKDFRTAALTSWGIVYNVDEEIPPETSEDETGDDETDAPAIPEDGLSDPDLDDSLLEDPIEE